MANQLTINIGTVPNDGTGDPLRTAFNEVNLNFSNVWATGLMNSNVQFSNTRITTSLTNANLILAPNGTGKVASNVDIVPNTHQAFNLGSPTRRWNTVYTQYIDGTNLTISGDLAVGGNLTVTGNIIEMGNIVTDALTLQLANTAANNAAANGAGITVGASDNIATLLYRSSSNAWTTNIGLSVTGNIAANFINVANNVNAVNDVIAKRGTFSGDPVTGDAALYVGSPTFTVLGTDVMAQFTGNVPAYAQINLQNYGNSPTASGDYIITADNGTDTTHFLDLGLAGSTWDGSEPNSLGNRIGPNDGYLYVQDGDFVLGTSNGTIATWKFDQTGNLTAPGNITTTGNITANYFFGNGSQLTGINVSSISNGTSNTNIPVANGNVTVTTAGTNTFTFNTAGNITLPSNTSGINYANGSSILDGYATISSAYSSNATTQSINISDGGGSYYNASTLDINYTAYTGASTLNFDIAYQAPLNANIGVTVGAVSTPLIQSNANIQIQANTGTAQTWTFDTTGNLSVPGNIYTASNVVAGNISTTGSGGDITLTGGDILGVNIVVTAPTALANLTAVAGGRAFVNNANMTAAGNFGNIVGSGGSNVVPVWSDGSNWYIG